MPSARTCPTAGTSIVDFLLLNGADEPTATRTNAKATTTKASRSSQIAGTSIIDLITNSAMEPISRNGTKMTKPAFSPTSFHFSSSSFPSSSSTTTIPQIFHTQMCQNNNNVSSRCHSLPKELANFISSSSSSSSSSSNSSASASSSKVRLFVKKSRAKGGNSNIFTSTRFLIALLLCLCYLALSISIANISVSMVCMVRRRNDVTTSSESAKKVNENGTNTETLVAKDCHHLNTTQTPYTLDWSAAEQGLVFAAQNAGALLMVFTGPSADMVNSKWTIVGALLLLVLSNALIPLVAFTSVWWVIGTRLLVGLADALLMPSTSSLVTRWFPPRERPFAVGIITGGRQIGALIIMPLAGFLCASPRGWPSIFFVSATVAAFVLLSWLLIGADKPAKHCCISLAERCFVERKIAEERLGKRTERPPIPWRELATCGALFANIAALVCHEYPMVIMIQLLPKYLNDVLKVPNVLNGFLSALPTAIFFASKTISSSLSTFILARKRIDRTLLVKVFNGIASLGLSVSLGLIPLVSSSNNSQQQMENGQKSWTSTIAMLCLANAFAGLHTPGVQSALMLMAPAYAGVITGIAFGCMAFFSIINKMLAHCMVQNGSMQEWSAVFWTAAVIALLPVGFFTLWGSADLQPWSTTSGSKQKSPKMIVCKPTNSIPN